MRPRERDFPATAQSSDRTVRRRAVLAALGGGATALTGGCLRRLRSVAGWRDPRQVRFRIRTLPGDADPYALPLARSVADWFRAAGLGVDVVPTAPEELRRQSLLRSEFDLFVSRLPPRFRRPDALYALLHSQFAEAPGWQNPFGYANRGVDDLLERQRRAAGERRRELLARLQVTVAQTQPFTLLTVPDDVRAVRRTGYAGWRTTDLRSPLGYLTLARSESTEGDGGPGSERREDTLRLAVTDRERTANLNPLSVGSHSDPVVTGLLYDPLGYPVGGGVAPWLAESWTLSERDAPVARVSLREGVTWHDGEPLTASDVAFTHELLADTTLGEGTDDAPVPAPRFRGRTSLVDDVTALDDATAEFRFVEVDPAVAVRAFARPVLPEHVWRDRTDRTALGGEDGSTTAALATDNVPPVGGGPLRYVRSTPREALVLERFGDHFLTRELSSGTLPGRVGPAPFERLSVRAVGSDVAAVERVASGEADVTGTPVGADAVPRIARADDVSLLADESDAPYVVGYNARRTHLDDPQFRRTLARLVDGAFLAESVLDGYGRPAVGPLWSTEWYPRALEWSEGNPVTPFLGRDGSVDVGRARAAFRDAGYRYEDGLLVDDSE